jgi:hypothetical protein
MPRRECWEHPAYGPEYEKALYARGPEECLSQSRECSVVKSGETGADLRDIVVSTFYAKKVDWKGNTSLLDTTKSGNRARLKLRQTPTPAGLYSGWLPDLYHIGCAMILGLYTGYIRHEMFSNDHRKCQTSLVNSATLHNPQSHKGITDLSIDVDQPLLRKPLRPTLPLNDSFQ